MHSISLCAPDDDILRVRDDPFLVSPKTLGCMQQVAPFLADVRRKADGGHCDSPVADIYGVFELLREREGDGGRKGEELEDVLKRHFRG